MTISMKCFSGVKVFPKKRLRTVIINIFNELNLHALVISEINLVFSPFRIYRKRLGSTSKSFIGLRRCTSSSELHCFIP